MEVSVEIGALPDSVWKMISEGQEIQKWLAPQARVVPGEGGSMWLSWGEPYEAEARIDVWQPGERLRTNGLPSAPTREKVQGGPMAMIVDYRLEAAHGGKTVLRLVQSGFGDSSDWDDEFAGTSIGWRVYLSNLKHLLTYHPDKTPRGLMHMAVLRIPLAEAWSRLTTALSIGGCRRGERYSITTPWGERLEGVIEMLDPEQAFIATDERRNQALIGFTLVRRMGIEALAWGALLFDSSEAEAEALKSRWAGFLDALLAP
ncbi:MAG: SRPBCC family protein [Bryobacteraceae bacterium]